VRLVDRAHERDAVAETLCDHVRIAAEAVDDARVRPPTVGGDPARRREVMERGERRQPVLVKGVKHTRVVIERRL
jgi:hypothetical protein